MKRRDSWVEGGHGTNGKGQVGDIPEDESGASACPVPPQAIKSNEFLPAPSSNGSLGIIVSTLAVSSSTLPGFTFRVDVARKCSTSRTTS